MVLSLLLFIIGFVLFALSFVSITLWWRTILFGIIVGLTTTVYLPRLKKNLYFSKVSKCQTTTNLLLVFWMIELLIFAIIIFKMVPADLDGIIQLWQAKIYAAGAITAPVRGPLEFFFLQNVVYNANRMFSQYPPFHPALLALGVKVGAVWIVPIIVTITTFITTIKAAFYFGGHKIKKITTLLLPIMGFILPIGTSFLNHVTTCFGSSLILLGLGAILNRKSYGVVCVPLGLGIIASLRPLTALSMFIAVILSLLCLIFYKRKIDYSPLKLFIGISGAALISSTYPIANYLLTGDPLLTSYELLWGPSHLPGFHLDPWGNHHTLTRGLFNALQMGLSLNEELFSSAVPGLMILAFPLLFCFKQSQSGRICSIILLLPLVMIAFVHVMYWHTDFIYGPRLWYEASPFMLILAARGVLTFKVVFLKILIKNEHRANFRRSLHSAFFAIMVLIFFIGIPEIMNRHHLRSQTLKADIASIKTEKNSPKLIFVADLLSSRIIARLRGHGVSASQAEYFYAKIPSCDLWEIVSKNWIINGVNNHSEIIKSLTKLENRKYTLISARSLPDYPYKDGAIKFDTDKLLSQECISELMKDDYATNNYMLLSALADPSSANIIIARDLGEHNKTLIQLYPHYTPYLLVKEVLKKM